MSIRALLFGVFRSGGAATEKAVEVDSGGRLLVLSTPDGARGLTNDELRASPVPMRMCAVATNGDVIYPGDWGTAEQDANPPGYEQCTDPANAIIYRRTITWGSVGGVSYSGWVKQ